MKIHNLNTTQISYFFSFMVLLCIVLLPNQNSYVHAADTDPPTLSITNPVNGSYLKNKAVTISGTVSDIGTPSPDQINMKILENSIEIGSLPANADGTWTFTKDFSEGAHTVTIEATDAALNTSPPSTLTFTIDTSRPKITAIEVSVQNPIDQTQGPLNILTYENMTRVLLDSKITFTLNDNDLLENIDLSNPITLLSKQGNVTGTTTFKKDTQVLEFIPTTNLSPNTTYYVLVNPKLIDTNQNGTPIMDKAGNPLFPKILKFTSISNQSTEDPHGNYTNNVNTCINCHSTHVGTTSDLSKQTTADNYCMACHDGTAAPLPENMDADHAIKHDNLLDQNLSKAGACTQCHNPHLNWTKENPNHLKDHFVYQHTDPTIGAKDSQNELCESCHNRNTTLKKDATGVNYFVFQYKNSSSASGKSSDYEECLRCHNGQKAGVTDIKTFYDNPASKHRITALDGSPLIRSSDISSDGHIPCAECHDTHGSKNIDILKDKIGHEDRQSFNTGTETTWTVALERQFCMKCHNGTTTINGVTGKSLNTFSSAAHETNSTEACHTCHGGNSRSFIEAAHAPQSATPTP